MPREVYQGATQKIQSAGGKSAIHFHSTSVRLDKDENGVDVNRTMYREIIGSLYNLLLVGPT